MRLRSHSFPKQAPAPQRDGRPALGRRCHAKALRWRFFPLSYDLIRALSLGGSRPRRLANLTRETLDSARVRARRGAKLEPLLPASARIAAHAIMQSRFTRPRLKALDGSGPDGFSVGAQFCGLDRTGAATGFNRGQAEAWAHLQARRPLLAAHSCRRRAFRLAARQAES